MAAAMFAKKDPNDADSSETPGGDAPNELEQLTSQLGKLGELLAQANREIAAYLVRRESRAPAGDGGETTGVLGRRIAELAEKVDKLAASSPAGAPSASPAQSATPEQAPAAAIAPLREQLDRLEASVKRLSEAAGAPPGGDSVTSAAVLDAVRQLQVQLDAGLRQLTDLLAPPEEEETVDYVAAPPTSAQWEQVIVGPALAANPALAFQRRQLLDGVLEGQAGACALAGQLLVFQSAPPERLPQLLKDIGEAFYRWQPKASPGTNPMEEALADWLQRSCETAGINNTIELVHPGERFDSTRHTATSRGVEITEARGWIVLRDNGRVYTKATVEVR